MKGGAQTSDGSTPISPPDFVGKIGPAAEEFGGIILDAYTLAGGRVHLETVIGALAALAGEAALRATADPQELSAANAKFVSGRPADNLIFSEHITERQKWPMKLGQLIGLLADSAAKKNGFKPLPDVPAEEPYNIAMRMEVATGSPGFPPLSVSAEYYPLEWSPNACVRFRKQVADFAEKHQLTRYETAVTICFALGQMFKQCSSRESIATCAQMAFEIMIGTARLVPLEKEFY